MLPKAKIDNILTQSIDEELLIYDLDNHKASCLNQTSAMVWQTCNGYRDIAEIGRVISKKLKTPISEDFVRLALSELKKEQLLEDSSNMDDLMAGTSRREMVKKVGLASMIALPVISSVVVPNAAHAQSNLLPLFAGCSSNFQCASSNCYPSAAFGQVCCSSTTNNLGLSQNNPFCAVSCATSGPTTCCSGMSDGGLFGSPSCPVGQLLCMCVDS